MLGQLLEQTVLANDIFGFLVVRQQLIDQLLVDGHGIFHFLPPMAVYTVQFTPSFPNLFFLNPSTLTFDLSFIFVFNALVKSRIIPNGSTTVQSDQQSRHDFAKRWLHDLKKRKLALLVPSGRSRDPCKLSYSIQRCSPPISNRRCSDRVTHFCESGSLVAVRPLHLCSLAPPIIHLTSRCAVSVPPLLGSTVVNRQDTKPMLAGRFVHRSVKWRRTLDVNVFY